MTPERWREVEAIFHSALQREPDARNAFIVEACGSDEDLQREVISLVSKDQSPMSTLSHPVAELEFDSTMAVLMAGTQLGPYLIEGALGAGGMGQVYQAQDARLGRKVAIKVSAKRFSDRFEREARAIAALNHSHICTLYDVGPDYLVMELLEGETLATRLKREALPMDQVLRFGAQIADALAAAHAKGVIHRDLKPGNVMVTKTGVKVLDFGLAKSVQDETLTMPQAVMGTPAYMAPEQSVGEKCDARTDIYSLGLMLAEMATGVAKSTEGLTGSFAHVVELCLVRDAEERWQSARDIQHELEWIKASKTTAPVPQESPTPWFVIAIAFLLVAALAFFSLLQPHPLEDPTSRLAINAPPGADFLDGLAISPDGRSIVFAARLSGQGKLWVRPLDSLRARELPGTDGATFPFWSPDSRSIAFFAAGKLRRVDVASGFSTVICDVGSGRGGTWSENGTILFNSVNDGPLLRVAASGGTPAPLTRVDQAHSENSHRFPFFLPDGRKFLFYVRANEDVSGVYLGSLDRPQEKIQLFRSPTAAIFAPGANGASGHLVWVENGALMVRPFDPERGQFKGEALPLAERVRLNYPAGRYAEISAARNGTIVYGISGDVLRQLTWHTRDGKTSGTIGPPDSYAGLRFSPNGKQLAVVRAASAAHPEGIALMDVARGIATPLVEAFWGAWSPGGERIAFTGGTSAGSPKVQLVAIDGAQKREQLTYSNGSEMVLDWSRDGRFILYWEQSNDLPATRRPMLWVLPVSDRKPFPFAPGPPQNPTAQFSPDGRWIAYSSRDSGRVEVYVQGFPTGAKWQVSNEGGGYPRWTKDGRELVYLSLDRTLTSVSVHPSGNGLDFTTPSPLFKISLPAAFTGSRGDDTSYPFDLSSDGQRILALAASGESAPQMLVLLSNWANKTSAAR
jgi:Tol biopolymer transport system component